MRLALLFLTLCWAGCQCLQPVGDGPDGGCATAAQCPAGSSCTGGAPFAQVAICTNGRCDFLEAVCPLPDGGHDAGLDAGCTTAAQCPPGSSCTGGAPFAHVAVCTAGKCGFIEAVCPPRDGGCDSPLDCSGSPTLSSWCGGTDAGFSCIESTCVSECPVGGAGRTCTVNTTTYCLECSDGRVSCPLVNNCGDIFSANGTVEPGSTCTTWPGTNSAFTDIELMRTASPVCRYAVSGPMGTPSLGDWWRLENQEYIAYFPGFGGWCTGRSAFTGAPRSIVTCPDCQFTLMGFE